LPNKELKIDDDFDVTVDLAWFIDDTEIMIVSTKADIACLTDSLNNYDGAHQIHCYCKAFSGEKGKEPSRTRVLRGTIDFIATKEMIELLIRKRTLDLENIYIGKLKILGFSHKEKFSDKEKGPRFKCSQHLIDKLNPEPGDHPSCKKINIDGDIWLCTGGGSLFGDDYTLSMENLDNKTEKLDKFYHKITQMILSGEIDPSTIKPNFPYKS
jgi:hypothetical protein